MAGSDLVNYDSDSDAVLRIERLDRVEGALLRAEARLDEFADGVGAALDDMKRALIRTTVMIAGLQIVACAALLYFL